MFSISTVASSTRMPTASARPPRVMMLMVSPSAPSIMRETMIDSGIETAMMIVLRKLPRKTRINDGGEAGGDNRLTDHSRNCAANTRSAPDRKAG